MTASLVGLLSVNPFRIGHAQADAAVFTSRPGDPEGRMAEVAYDLKLIDPRLPDDESQSVIQVETINRIVREHGGAMVEAWDFRFTSFEIAQRTASALRQAGIQFERVEIRAVDARSGTELPS